LNLELSPFPTQVEAWFKQSEATEKGMKDRAGEWCNHNQAPNQPTETTSLTSARVRSVRSLLSGKWRIATKGARAQASKQAEKPDISPKRESQEKKERKKKKKKKTLD